MSIFKAYIKVEARTIADVSLTERGYADGGQSLEGFSSDTGALDRVAKTLSREGWAVDYTIVPDGRGVYKLNAYRGGPSFMGPM